MSPVVSEDRRALRRGRPHGVRMRTAGHRPQHVLADADIAAARACAVTAPPLDPAALAELTRIADSSLGTK
jgi:hypothetical protein